MEMQQKENKDFVNKLYDILEDSKYTEYIKWNTEGTSFIIINPKEFAEKVLKSNFRHNNLSSFVRQLNKYDFHKKKSNLNLIYKYGPQILEFEHVHFQRNCRSQLYKIKRKTSSTDKTSQLNNLLPGIENNYVFQNHVVSTIKALSDKFQLLIENIGELKDKVNALSSEIYNKDISVLIYDSEINTAMYIFTLLKEYKLNMTIIDSRNNLFDALKHATFQFIIISAPTDFFMDSIRYLRSFDFKTPVIYIGFDESCIDSYSMGKIDFIKRPFTYATFSFVVKKYISRIE